jgi:4-alpha-glucanotransferase
VLLHPTSLPGGDLGDDADRFVDFLADTGFSVWQCLPLGPTHEDGSPYHALSAHAGNPELISRARLWAWGWLDEAGAPAAEMLPRARHAALADGRTRDEYAAYVDRERDWLEDYALFRALRAHQRQAPWWEWPASLRDRDAGALTAARGTHAEAIEAIRFEQFVFDRQWDELHRRARARGVSLFGDMPIFVAHDSADVWASREYFRLDAQGQPVAVAGVPPDYFSAEGQRWGNPLYDWERLAADGFGWWLARLRTELERFDLLRVDHFRGFEACWEIPAGEATAVNGRWAPVPGDRLFSRLREVYGDVPLVAEDLGHITPAVHALRRKFGLPGMRVLQFAFDGGAGNPYLPHAHTPDSVVYTGTHDNDTTRAWFELLPPTDQLRVMNYLGYPTESMPLPLIRAALASVAQLAILPMPDVLQLGRGHRLNTPGTTVGNWRWRFEWEWMTPDIVRWFSQALALYDRRPESR